MNIHFFKNILIIGIIFWFIINNSITINPLSFKCDNYLFNTYLYLILAVAIILATIDTMSYNKVFFNGWARFVIAVFSIILIVIISNISAKHFLTKHLLFIIFIALMASMLYPLYIHNKILFNQTALTTLILLVILSFIAMFFPQYIGNNWITYLTIALIGLIIARIVEMGFSWYNKKESKNVYSRIISYISILVFIMFVLYDTKKVQEHAKLCIEADYINESLNLFLDGINLFSNIYNVQDL